MKPKWDLIYLSHQQNKTTLEIQNVEPCTPTSNLLFFTVLLPTVVWVVWQLAVAFPASDLSWLYYVKNKDSFYIVSAWARQNNFSAKSRKLGSGRWKMESWEPKRSEANQKTEVIILKKRECQTGQIGTLAVVAGTCFYHSCTLKTF